MVGWESRCHDGQPPSRETTLTTITIIGAGGFEFPLTLGADFLSFESLRDATLVLMDIDPATLARTERPPAARGRGARPAGPHHGHHRPRARR